MLEYKEVDNRPVYWGVAVDNILCQLVVNSVMMSLIQKGGHKGIAKQAAVKIRYKGTQ